MPFFWLFSSNITLYKYINQQIKWIVAIVQKNRNVCMKTAFSSFPQIHSCKWQVGLHVFSVQVFLFRFTFTMLKQMVIQMYEIGQFKLIFCFSLIDFFTIPPSFVSLILGRTWIGRVIFKNFSWHDMTKSRLLAQSYISMPLHTSI